MNSRKDETTVATSDLDVPGHDEIPSTVHRACSCTIFWRFLQLCNTLLVCTLFGLLLFEFTRVETLESQLAAEQDQITELQQEVRTKQEDQIEELHQEVQDEHDLTFLTLAGTFTLLTCLISMFHMSSHLQKMNQPIIQRKIVAILWMSPIYSITSFLSLLYPPAEGYLAIIRDFYESYCIYTFLSFLIAVLGRGSRDTAVEVLAMHAHHLERPTRCLSRWYDPPPETSDTAKANAVITECQILAMQFVFIRPLTTVIWVIYNLNKVTQPADESSSFDGYPTISPVGAYNPNGTRWLQDELRDTVGYAGSANNTILSSTFGPTSAPSASATIFNDYPTTTNTNTTIFRSPPAVEDQQDFTSATISYFTSFGFVMAMIVNVSVLFAFMGLLKFYHAVRNDLTWCRPWPKFLTIKGVVFLTFWQGLAILIFVHLSENNDGNESLSEDNDPSARAKRYQNILICGEMLLFSISHWCVFPSEEWEKDYEPPLEVNKPGFGMQDFVSDVGQIVQNGRRRRKGRRRRNHHRRPLEEYGGLYHRPTTASAVATTSPEGGEDGVYEETQSPVVFVDGAVVNDNGNGNHYSQRARIMSDDSSAKADDEFDDMELL